MNLLRVACGTALLLTLTLFLPWHAAWAQFMSSDAPYVPTPPAVIDAMFDMAMINTNDYVIDLGSGDGRVVIGAAKKFGVRAVGVEFDENLLFKASEDAKRQGVAGKVSFVREDLLKTDFSKASVLTLYLSRQINLQLRPRILSELTPGTRIVAHDFDMGNWKADQFREMPVPGKVYGPPRSRLYLWFVPANLAGKWRWQLTVGGQPRAYEARIDQLFQELDAAVLVDGGTALARNIKLRGDILDFTLTREMSGQQITHQFSGRIEGDKAVGRVRVSGGGEDATVDWVATRVERGKMRIE